MLRPTFPKALATALTALALALTGLPAGTAAESPNTGPETAHPFGTALTDTTGRTRVLRGINVVDKSGWHGRLAQPMLDKAAVRQLADIGFNHVRFGFTWDSIQHKRSQFDEAYIDQVISQLDLLAKYGMTAVIDVHQDAWSSAVGFDGAPTWADPQCNKAPDANLDQLTGQFFFEYLSPAVSSAFANFYADGYGVLNLHCTGRIMTDFVEMWTHLADRLAGHPAVIGYDLLNEPWFTSAPGVFESTVLTPFYKKVTTGIRKVDRTTPIYFEPVPIYQSSVPYLGSAPDARSVFAPHLYTEEEAGIPISTNGVTEAIALGKSLADGAKLGTPTWIGEWGATEDATYISRFYDLLDKNFASAAFWADLQNPGDRLATPLEAPHVRPYVEAFPGAAVWNYNAAGKVFEVTITTRTAKTQAQLVIPPRLGLREVSNSGGALEFPGGGEACTTAIQGPCRATWMLPIAGSATLRLAVPTN